MIRAVTVRRGRQGTLDTLALIRGMGLDGANNDDVRRVVAYCELTKWDGLLRQCWQFAEEEEETLRSVRIQSANMRSYGRMIGDCDDAAVVAVALAAACHLRFKIVAVRPGENAEFSHVFVEVQDVRGWFRIDPTGPINADYTGWERLECAG